MVVVLIVEDEALVRLVAEMTIQDCGYQILSARDVDEALLLLRSSRQIDALFTDIHLKAAIHGGCDLARQAIALRPNLRILYTTGSSVTDQMKSLFVKSSHFLPKPYTDQQLQDSIQNLLAP
jgi:CheY-like chemotaxis protein